mgnify:CR=1 FL=1
MQSKQLVKSNKRVPIAELNRASRRKQKLPFTLWKLIDVRKEKVVAISTWTAVQSVVCSHAPRGRSVGKVGNPFRAEMLNMKDPNAFVATPNGTPDTDDVGVPSETSDAKETNIKA